MRIGQFVTYQTGHGCYGLGKIESVNEEFETLVVIDREDGSRWKGSMDHAEICDSDSHRSEMTDCCFVQTY